MSNMTACRNWLAIDVGGANLKAADGLGYAASRPFALWRSPERLAEELAALLAAAPRCGSIAITMTGELADCYATKADGVVAILDAVEQAAAGRLIRVYTTAGELITPAEARATPLLAAASNWHALAAYAARQTNGEPALLVDLGSTTADVIPLDVSAVQARGRTDAERLIHGELVYVGVERTPICALVRQLRWRDQACPVASELFATTLDVFLILGDITEQSDRTDTADGQPRTRQAARTRLARMVCADATTFSAGDALAAAESIRDALIAAVEGACCRVASQMDRQATTVFLSGAGEFLLRRIFAARPWPADVRSLADAIGSDASVCAPAHALAILASEQFPEGADE